MIKVDELKELIKTILYTGYVADEKPLSIMFVGHYGTGKSEILNSFNVNDNIAFFTDVTYMGLIKLLQENKEVRHIVIPDFLKITMKKQSTTQNIISCFNALIEEGIDKISMMGQSFDFKGKKAGLITATTKNSYIQNKRTWTNMGLLSRMLIISYDYGDETIEEIFDYIMNRRYLTNSKKLKLNMPIKNMNVILPIKLAKMLRDKDTDFRTQKQYQTLAMARTLMDNRSDLVVNEKDIKVITKFKRFINLDYSKI